jgi:hypothetical protein
VGKEPILRLIHTLVDNDEIKRAYLQHFNFPSDRMAIENRNTPESRAACYWTMMAQKWNDPHFSPSLFLMGELHSDFGLPIVIDHNVVSDMAAATPEKVKDKWSLLIHELKRKIENWERSGQGYGGDAFFDDKELDLGDVDFTDEHRPPSPAFGELSNCPCRALDLHSLFIRDNELYLLYLWEVLDWNILMVLSLQRLDNSVVATNGAKGIPSVIGDKTRGDKSSVTTGGESEGDKGNSTTKIQQLSKTINAHGKKMVSVAKLKVDQRERELSYAKQAEVCNSICTLLSEKRQLMI